MEDPTRTDGLSQPCASELKKSMSNVPSSKEWVIVANIRGSSVVAIADCTCDSFSFGSRIVASNVLLSTTTSMSAAK